jgi:hypothetical protein
MSSGISGITVQTRINRSSVQTGEIREDIPPDDSSRSLYHFGNPAVLLTLSPVSAMLPVMLSLRQTGYGMFSARVGRGRPGPAKKAIYYQSNNQALYHLK